MCTFILNLNVIDILIANVRITRISHFATVKHTQYIINKIAMYNATLTNTGQHLILYNYTCYYTTSTVRVRCNIQYVGIYIYVCNI
jgi:hypothetical protein